MKDASRITLAVYTSKQSLSSLENEFARHFSLRGTQSSHGEVSNKFRPEAFARFLAAILDFIFGHSDDRFEGWFGPGVIYINMYN